MSAPIDDGGPAFPGGRAVTLLDPDTMKVTDVVELPSTGMSLRDYFAGQVIACVYGDYLDAEPSPQEIAKIAYEIADAMLAERKRGGVT